MNGNRGRGAQIRPENRFRKAHSGSFHMEGIDDGEQPDVRTRIFEEDAAGLINEVKSQDLGIPYSMNPYQGCEHGCAYCYARTTHEYYGFDAGLDFESRIVVKRNAATLLERELMAASWRPAPIMLSGNTDCYQPVERQLGITRKLLEVLVRYRNPVGVITKNSLILRDLDLLKDLASENLVHVMISITTLDEDLRRRLEPRTATAVRRLQVISELTAAGIPTGVMVAPIIPGINHHEIPAIMEAAAQHGAMRAGMTVVRLNGSIGSVFRDWLQKHYPERVEKVMRQVAALHGGAVEDTRPGRRIMGAGTEAEIIHRLFQVARARHFRDRNFPPYNLTRFRRGGMLPLF